MRTIATFFIRGKHWQIFLLFAALYLAAGALSVLLDSSFHEPGMLPGLRPVITLVVFASMLSLLFLFLGWFASVGFFLASITEPTLQLKTRFFRFSLLYPAVYLPLAALGLSRLPTDGLVFICIFPFHLISALCSFYNFYFVARSLKQAETGKQASFSNYAASFVLLWFFPIGIWIVQPRIRQLYAEHNKVQITSANTA